ncbi:D-glycerate dehydrogenase [Saccharopolyspora rhizosphaerae]|uniref:D-glycerate dehydrogenase n=1 Tax=Saccharopolyspora rhizosphaerae TaxID=2492662 RepID=A0A426JYI5_9PSEU|nr:D-glycerate dehydrogenase [Saccharopolyspora rhizosphaerae]RRO18209.1 D-glycerate dehydrogenase [Saccharopolyspora rhizosphaerae]
MSRVVVTRAVPESAVELLREVAEVEVCDQDRPLAPEELREAVNGADGVVAMLHDRIDAELVEAAGEQLRVVANVAVGYDNIDVPAVSERGVTVTNTPGVLTDATADLAFGLLLSVTRRLGEGERLLRSRTPWTFRLDFMLGTGLQGKTLGVVGLGGIGQAVARRARAFGMHIAYTGRRRAAQEVEAELDARYLPMEELLRTADVISLHCPLTEQTHHLVDDGALAAMKPTAIVVNTSRGPVVDEKALARALREGRIGGAALDVFENEPEVDPGLLELDNVAMAPHLGSATTETRTAMAELAARNVAAVLTGEPPLTPVTA